MRAQDSLPSEPHLLGHTLRGRVVRVSDEIQPLKRELVESPPREKPQRTCTHDRTPSVGPLVMRVELS